MVISLEESHAQIDRLWERAHAARRSGDREAALQTLRSMLDHPCARPAGEWELAIDRWPDLLDDLPADHRSYSHRIEARLKRLSKEVPGHPLSISPLTVAELVDVHGDDADTGEARSSLAAEVARSGRALGWPPARNDRCWCGSGQKYKKCCGPVPPVEDEE